MTHELAMSATSAVTAAQQGALAAQIQSAVAKKTLDAAQANGAAVVELLQAAAALATSPGKGEQFDAVG